MQTIILLTVSAVLWTVAILLVPSAVRGRRRSLVWFLSVFALTMSLQPRPIYNAVDSFLGGGNVTYFLFHALAIVAVGLANVMVQEGVSPSGATRKHKQVTAALAGVIIAVQAALFFANDWRFTENISQAFIARWDYAAYASTTWITLAIFSVSVSYACLADMRRQTRMIIRMALGFITLGSVCVLIYAGNSVIGATQTVFEPGFIMPGWREFVQKVVLLSAPISLGVGLGLTATVDGLRSSGRTLRDRVLLWHITPLWRRLLATNPELSIERQLGPWQLLTVRRPGVHLYRRYVEIRDCLLVHPEQALSPADVALLDRAEARTQARLPVSHATPAGLK